jgi:hypothetical protein
MRTRTAVHSVILVATIIAGCSEPVPSAVGPTPRPASPSAKPVRTTPLDRFSGRPPATPSKLAVAPPKKRPFRPHPRKRSGGPVKLAFHRWAVICSGDAEQAGLGDLVTTGLSKAKDMELVDREQLQAVLKELQLASVMESQAAASRLKMGQLLKADALLLLSLETRDKARVLKVVVSECLCGARLRTVYEPYDPAAGADVAQQCAEVIAEVREHFAGGIRQIVGVSPFLSKDLVHDYDRFQIAFARLLESGLMAIPQVAVIEVEEARAIGRETALAGSESLDRPTPLLVEGQYAISRGGGGKREVQLELTCQRAAGQQRTIRPPAMPLAAAAHFITNDLPLQILPNRGNASEEVSPEEQFEWLVARADAFSQVGAWQEGTDLLEAALLLSPDDFSVRVKLLVGYAGLLENRGRWLNGKPEQVVREGVAGMIDAYLAYLGHVEYLIRNRRLNAGQAIAAFRGPWAFRFWPNYRNGDDSWGSSVSFRDLFQRQREAEERFLFEVYPQVLQLPLGRPGEDPEFAAVFIELYWYKDAVHTSCLAGLVAWFTREKACRGAPAPEDLDLLFRLLTQVAPDRWGIPVNLAQFLDRYPSSQAQFVGGNRVVASDDDWLGFLRRLAASHHRMASLFGRYGLLSRQWQLRMATPKKSRKPEESLLAEAEAEAWLKDYTVAANSEPTYNRLARDEFRDYVERIRNGLVYEMHPNKPVAPRAPRPYVVLPQESGTAQAQVKFEEIPLEGLKCDGFEHLIACGDEGDVAWQTHAVVLFPKNGAVLEFAAPPTVTEVHWDGRQIWIATWEGMIVQSFSGKVLARIGPDQGLPPSDQGLMLHVLAPGKVCAAGSFGKDRRGWCATVELIQGETKVAVFHQATHVELTLTIHSGDDPQRAFEPASFYDYDPGNGQPRVLLLSRASLNPPLAIDRTKWKVSLWNGLIPVQCEPYTDFYANRRGDVLQANRVFPAQVFASPATMPAKPEEYVAWMRSGVATVRTLTTDYPASWPTTQPERMRLVGGSSTGRYDPKRLEVDGSRILEYHGSLYVPGRFGGVWFRIDPETFHAEVLGSDRRQSKELSWYAVSSRYGLVAGSRAMFRFPYSPARFFRVIVEESAKEKAMPSGEKEQPAPKRADSGPGVPRVVHALLSFGPDPASAAEVGADRAETRTWTSAGGGFRVRARLVEAGKEAVVLEKEDGVRAAVPRARLSKADLDYLALHAAAESAAGQPAIEHQTSTPLPGRAASAAIPGADNPKAFTENDYRKQHLEYATRIYRDAYLKVGKKNPAWDAAALDLLDAAARMAAYRDLPRGWVYDTPSDKDMHALAVAARERGCDDPLVFRIFAATLAREQWNPALTQTAMRMLDELQERHYPPVHRAMLAGKILGVTGNAEAGDVAAALIESLAAAACAKEYQGIDRRFVLETVRGLLDGVPGGLSQLAGKLRSRPDADPWLASVILGEVEIARGGRAQNSNRIVQMVGEPPQDPKSHWEAAREHLLKAWTLHRDYPEPAVLLMRLAEAGGGAAEDTPRLWFDHAAAAQFDWTPAYTEMRQHLVNCDDVDAIYAFGVECLKTGRYDTDVPWRFLVVLSDIQLVTKSDAYWRRPEVYANLCEFFRKNAQDTRNKNMDFFHSQEALLAYGAGHFQDARKALDKVGDRMVKHGVFLVNAGDVDLAIARTYALTGPLAVQVQAMEKADQAGQAEQAAQACRQMLATLDRADKGRPYLRDRLVTTQIEARCAAGEWTPVQPDTDLAGWSATVGQWSVDDKGGLVGKWNPSDPCAAMLLCHAKIGPNFELMGHAEVVESEGGGSFGAILSFANRQSFWECSFYPAVTADTGERLHLPLGNQAYVRCAALHNPHGRPAKVTRSDDFRVQVFDRRVATTVGAEIHRENVPFIVALDHDPPSGDSPWGVCANRGVFTRRYAAITNAQLEAMRSGISLEPPVRSPTVVRFTELKIRRMTKPPTQFKVPQPE